MTTNELPEGMASAEEFVPTLDPSCSGRGINTRLLGASQSVYDRQAELIAARDAQWRADLAKVAAERDEAQHTINGHFRADGHCHESYVKMGEIRTLQDALAEANAALADINHRWVEREGLLLDAQLKLAGEQAECREIMVMADRILDALASDHQGGPPCAAECESCNLVAEMAVALSRAPGSTEALEVMIERACELAREADYDGHCFTPEQIVSRILGDERKGDAR